VNRDQACSNRSMPPAFPENGPSCTPVFDGLDLKLLKHATPPETLVRNVDKLGLELKDGKLEPNPSGKQGEFVWPPPKGGELEKILQKEELEKVCLASLHHPAETIPNALFASRPTGH
jgi:hypothetical protein